MAKDYGPREAFILEIVTDNPSKGAIEFHDGDKKIWIPRSILSPEHEHITEISDGQYEVMVPIWFAEDNEMV